MTLPRDQRSLAQAFLAVLNHPNVAKSVDERFFEAMLATALTELPFLASALFGKDAHPVTAWELGPRGAYADVVG